jgi:16S rRNA (cytidine1402-2'-O)-methyltransferase
VSVPGGAGLLVLVATPIGNLGDLSPRARDALAGADVVCCEDTRRTRALLSACGLPSSPARLVALHGHNEAARVPEVLAWLADGRTVALVTDAGTPAVSDPGLRLVRAATDAGFSVTEVPGPSAVIMALTLSGLDTDRFCVEGFLPRKGAERRRRLEALGVEARTAVLFEAPGRVAALLADLLASGGDRAVALCRELTKVHEEVWRGSLTGAIDAVAARPPVGEVVVVLGGAAPPPVPDDDAVRAAVAARLAEGDSTRQAADAVAGALGVARRRAYNEALSLRDGPPEGD